MGNSELFIFKLGDEGESKYTTLFLALRNSWDHLLARPEHPDIKFYNHYSEYIIVHYLIWLI